MRCHKKSIFAAVTGTILTLFGGVLIWIIMSLPGPGQGLRPQVERLLARSGVENPVTAVLLNFRGYDTLLEITVLLAAALGVYVISGDNRVDWESLSEPVLIHFLRPILSVLVLVSGYLLWVGAYRPGGAFQAGAVLGAAGVLLHVCGINAFVRLNRRAVLMILASGPFIFLVIAGSLSLVEGQLLRYPPPHAGFIILVIEAVSTISIALILVTLFVGRPVDGENSVTDTITR